MAHRPLLAVLPLLVGLLLAAAGPGCSRSVKQYRPNPAELDAAAYRDAYSAAQRVLDDAGFALDRQEYRFGRLTTLPLAAPTVLEPWHGSNTTPTQTATSTINRQRRVATVTFEPVTDEPADAGVARDDEASTAAPGREPASADHELVAPPVAVGDEGEPVAARYRMLVEVQVERYQRATRYLTGSTASRNVFGNLRGVPAEWRDRGIAAANYWVSVGRDPELEQRLLQAILARMDAAPAAPADSATAAAPQP